MSTVSTTLAIAAGIAGGAGAAYAGHEAAGAAREGAASTASAANYAADKTSAANAASLAFEKQKDAEAQAQAAATQRANYDQWAARETRMNDIRSALGMPSHPIPAYVPTVTGGAPPTTGPTPGGAPSVPGAPAPSGPAMTPGNPTDRGVILQNLQNVYKGLGVTPTGRGTGPTDIEYMADQVANTGGWTPQNAGYWPDRIKQELAKAGVGGGAAPASSIAAFLPSTAAPVASGPRQLPYLNPNGNIYSPTIASYLQS
jgi:hypothetical protein